MEFSGAQPYLIIHQLCVLHQTSSFSVFLYFSTYLLPAISGTTQVGNSLWWRHNGCDSVSNPQLHHCLHNRLFRRRSKKTSKLHVTGICEGNSPETGEFPAQMARNAENVSIWWRHHVVQPFARTHDIRGALELLSMGVDCIAATTHGHLLIWSGDPHFIDRVY